MHQVSFSDIPLGSTGNTVRRLGLSASFWPGKKTIYEAVDNGITVFFCFGIDYQMLRVLRDIFKSGREKYTVISGAYNLLFTHTDIYKSFRKRSKQLGTDYIDYFLFLGVTKPKHMPCRVTEDLVKLKASGAVRGVGLSCHDRRLVGKLADEGDLDTIMMRYNAAHRGAEADIFPHLAAHNPTVISYTSTRWGYLLRRPKTWPKEEPIPTAPMCYRFVLSNPHVDIALTAPRNIKQLRENLAALEQGPLDADEMAFMRRFGDVVHARNKWFM